MDQASFLPSSSSDRSDGPDHPDRRTPTMRPTRLLSFLPLLAGFALLPSCVINVDGGGLVRATREESYEFDPGSAQSLKLTTRNGSIRVERALGTQVACTTKFRANAAELKTAQERVEAMFLDASWEGDALHLEVKAPESASQWGASLVVTAPAHLKLDLHASNGPIQVLEGFAEVRAESSNGSITADCQGGHAELSSSNGSLTLNGTPGSFDLHTSNGGVDVFLDGPFQGNGVVRTSNGSIHVTAAGPIDCAVETQTSNGKTQSNVEGQNQVGLLQLRTSNGGIYLKERR